MVNVLILIVIILIALYCASYGVWAWKNHYTRGAVGIFGVALLTLALPVAVWIYHNYL